MEAPADVLLGFGAPKVVACLSGKPLRHQSQNRLFIFVAFHRVSAPLTTQEFALHCAVHAAAALYVAASLAPSAGVPALVAFKRWSLFGVKLILPRTVPLLLIYASAVPGSRGVSRGSEIRRGFAHAIGSPRPHRLRGSRVRSLSYRGEGAEGQRVGGQGAYAAEAREGGTQGYCIGLSRGLGPGRNAKRVAIVRSSWPWAASSPRGFGGVKRCGSFHV